MKLNNLKKTD